MGQRPDVVVRRAEPDDAAAVHAMMSSPAVYPGLMQVPFPSVATWRDRLEDPPEGFRILVACHGDLHGEVVGHLGLGTSTRARMRHVGSLGMAVRDTWQGRGVGTVLVEAAVALADDWLQLTRLELEVFTDNTAALALYRAFGFEVEGTKRGAVFRDGDWCDTHLMARLHPRLVAELAARDEATPDG